MVEAIAASLTGVLCLGTGSTGVATQSFPCPWVSPCGHLWHGCCPCRRCGHPHHHAHSSPLTAHISADLLFCNLAAWISPSIHSSCRLNCNPSCHLSVVSSNQLLGQGRVSVVKTSQQASYSTIPNAGMICSSLRGVHAWMCRSGCCC